MNSCLYCGKPAAHQCAQCKQAYYCSADCKSADWKLAHEFECEPSENVSAALQNQWTGLFRNQTAAYANWINAVEQHCDPASEEALELRSELDTEIDKLKNQADRRFSEDTVNRFAESLKRFGVASILQDSAATKYRRQLESGCISEMVRVFGVGARNGVSAEDYQRALTAHVGTLIKLTETLKESASDREQVEATVDAALQTSVRVGQTFWGRAWRPDLSA